MASTLKRGLEDTEVDDGNKKIKADPVANTDDLMEVRVLIDNYEASVIIGKGGSNVKNIRTQTNSFVSILKTDSAVSKERVMTIKGTEDCIANALHAIIVLLLENANQRKLTNEPEAEPETQYTMKILIHKFLAGSIIGKGGVIIREIQESTGCRISISVDPLPASTEKSVSLTGTAETFHAGATRVLQQLVNNPLRTGCTTILYVPGAVTMPGGPYGAPRQGPPQGYNPYAPPPAGAAYGGPYGAPQPGAYMGQGGAAPMPGGPVAGAAGGAGGATKTEKIVIPTMCAGVVIGKGGSIIRDIKMQSSTHINIANPEPTTPNDRVVSVTGTHQGIQAAIYLIRQRVEAYNPNQPMA